MTKRFVRTWILVADASRARIFSHDKKSGYRMVQAFTHPESRVKRMDLMADDRGRKSMGVAGGGYGHPAAEPDTDPKEVEHEKFARELGGELERGLNEHLFEELVVVAPPHFLGLVKGSMPEQVQKRLVDTLSKDFAQLDGEELIARLGEMKAA